MWVDHRDVTLHLGWSILPLQPTPCLAILIRDHATIKLLITVTDTVDQIDPFSDACMRGRSQGKMWGWIQTLNKKVNCVKGSNVKNLPFQNESKQRRFSGFLEPLMSVFLASFAKYFWKRQPQIWFLVALKLKCQPDIALVSWHCIHCLRCLHLVTFQ